MTSKVSGRHRTFMLISCSTDDKTGLWRLNTCCYVGGMFWQQNHQFEFSRDILSKTVISAGKVPLSIGVILVYGKHACLDFFFVTCKTLQHWFSWSPGSIFFIFAQTWWENKILLKVWRRVHRVLDRIPLNELSYFAQCDWGIERIKIWNGLKNWKGFKRTWKGYMYTCKRHMRGTCSCVLDIQKYGPN